MEVKEKIVEETFKEFAGDLLITDPFYLIREGSGDDWTNLEKLGITKYLYRNTIYGDWGCHTYNTETKEAIGQFCADSGNVCVCLVSDVERYNPDFMNWLKDHDWCGTIIKGFKGTIHIRVFEVPYISYFTEKWEIDHEVRVEGEGNINFTTRQTSL